MGNLFSSKANLPDFLLSLNLCLDDAGPAGVPVEEAEGAAASHQTLGR